MTVEDLYSIMNRYFKRIERLKNRGIRMDSKAWREDASARLAYGIAKSMGIDTTGMKPQEVWKAIKENDKGAIRAGIDKYSHGGAKKLQKVNKESPTGKTMAKGKMRVVEYAEVKGMSKKAVEKLMRGAKKSTEEFYNKAAKVAGDPKNFFLRTFTTHQADHIRQVVDKTNQAINEVEKMGKGNPAYRGKIDRRSLLIAAQFHDTGMDGGNHMDLKDGDALRKAHGMNSAMHCLERRNDIEKLGGNPDLIAFLAFSHTKSASGVNDLSSPQEWSVALDKVEEEVKKYNAVNKDKPIKFNRDKVFGGEPNENNIGAVACSAAALRLGDANREANIPLRTQSGGLYKITKPPKGEFVSAEEEANASEVVIEHEGGIHKLCDENDKYFNGLSASSMSYSKRVVLGEQNMVKVDAKYVEGNTGKGSIQEDITLKDANSAPYCTAMALEERIGELNTINGIPRTMNINMTGIKNVKDFMQSHSSEAYGKLWDTICKKEGKGNTQKYAYEIANMSFVFDDGSVAKASDLFGTKESKRKKAEKEKIENSK